MKTMHKFSCIILVLILVTSCTKQSYYNKVYSFKGNEWSQKQKPSFVVDVKEADKSYVFTLNLRTTTEYKYSDLWIFMNTISPDGKKAREPFKICITNPDGTWIGVKTGTIVEHQFKFGKSKLPLKGKYTFILEQGVTESKIDNVLDIGLNVEEVFD